MNLMSGAGFQEEEIFFANPQKIECLSPRTSRVEKTDTEAAVWTDTKIKLLLSSVSEMRPKLGKSPKLINKSKMWKAITRRFKDNGYFFTTKQIMNKFSGLHRQYKKVCLQNKGTGRKRSCPYQSELENILRNRMASEIAEEYVELTIGDTLNEAITSSPHKKQTIDFSYQMEMLRTQKAKDARLLRERLETDARLSREQLQRYQQKKLEIIRKHMEKKDALLQAIFNKTQIKN